MTILAVIAFTAFAAILFIWLGYPVVIWLVAKVAAKPNHPNRTLAATRSVSIVLATRDSVGAIEARVENLLETTHPATLIEVIIALDSDGSKATPAMLAGLDERVRVVTGDLPGGKASTLNAGVRASTGDILVMADVAQRFDARTIPELVASLEDVRFGAVSGALELGSDGVASPVDLYWRLEKWLRYNEALIHSSVGVTGAVYATRRTLWSDIPSGTLLDDVYVPMSLVLKGQRVGFSYTAVARDVRTFDSKAEGARKARTLTGVLQLPSILPGLFDLRRNPVIVQLLMHKFSRLLTPLLFVAAFVAGAIVAANLVLHSERTLLIATSGILLLALGIRRVRRTLGSAVKWASVLLMAILKALVNGVRGRWQVWSR